MAKKIQSFQNSNTMFFGTSFNQDISTWDVSNVTGMSSMFQSSHFNHPIGNWDVSNVIDMSAMFRLSQFNQDLSGWNVNNVTFCTSFNENTPQWILPKPNFTNCHPN